MSTVLVPTGRRSFEREIVEWGRGEIVQSAKRAANTALFLFEEAGRRPKKVYAHSEGPFSRQPTDLMGYVLRERTDMAHELHVLMRQERERIDTQLKLVTSGILQLAHDHKKDRVNVGGVAFEVVIKTDAEAHASGCFASIDDDAPFETHDLSYIRRKLVPPAKTDGVDGHYLFFGNPHVAGADFGMRRVPGSVSSGQKTYKGRVPNAQESVSFIHAVADGTRFDYRAQW